MHIYVGEGRLKIPNSCHKCINREHSYNKKWNFELNLFFWNLLLFFSNTEIKKKIVKKKLIFGKGRWLNRTLNLEVISIVLLIVCFKKQKVTYLSLYLNRYKMFIYASRFV